MDLPRFRGELWAWDQGIWSEGILLFPFSGILLFGPRRSPFFRSLIATPNASSFFLADTFFAYFLACSGSFFCSTAPQAFFCPDRGFATPSRAAAVKDGPTCGPPEGLVLDGREHDSRQGPNKRMTPSRRVKCLQTRYPDPKPSTVHQIGASPECRGKGIACQSTEGRRRLERSGRHLRSRIDQSGGRGGRLNVDSGLLRNTASPVTRPAVDMGRVG